MNIIIVMIPLSFIILVGAVAAFFWAVNNDQFDDMDSPGLLPLSDERDDDDITDEAVEGAVKESTVDLGSDLAATASLERGNGEHNTEAR